MIAEKSAQPCGCDPGCGPNGRVCERHAHEAQEVIGAAERALGVAPRDSLLHVLPPPIGIGGAPMRPTILPSDPAERKKYPIASGVLDYFPDAIAYLAYVSWRGNEQHNPGQPLHWDRSKSSDEADTMMRHFAERGTLDTDGVRHMGKAAWRALALLQKEIEAERE